MGGAGFANDDQHFRDSLYQLRNFSSDPSGAIVLQDGDEISKKKIVTEFKSDKERAKATDQGLIKQEKTVMESDITKTKELIAKLEAESDSARGLAGKLEAIGRYPEDRIRDLNKNATRAGEYIQHQESQLQRANARLDTERGIFQRGVRQKTQREITQIEQRLRDLNSEKVDSLKQQNTIQELLEQKKGLRTTWEIDDLLRKHKKELDNLSYQLNHLGL